MKELSIEEKAKRYNEAIKVAENIYRFSSDLAEIKRMEQIFPELAESEDEKIRKRLIDFFEDWHKHSSHCWSMPVTDILAWLEKQGENAIFFNKIQIGDKVTRNRDGVLVNLSQLNRVAKPAERQGENSMGISKFLEKQGEQKPADKVEPEFHEGDWVVSKVTGSIYQIENCIENLSNHKYGYDLMNGGYINTNEVNRYRLWTIQDAKDGDVLVCKGELKYSNGIKYERICLFNNLDNAFFTLTKTSNFVEEYDIDVNIDYPDNTVPATKEQKEILFMAIKEAGYEWDCEKKELKKNIQDICSEEQREKESLSDIENRIINFAMQFHDNRMKPEAEWEDELKMLRDNIKIDPWNKEDEKILDGVITNYESGYLPSVEKRDKIIEKLKSLKERCTWKPSDEQMEALDDAIAICSERDYETECRLDNLRQDLKKLKQ